jgi:hypothetical protein
LTSRRTSRGGSSRRGPESADDLNLLTDLARFGEDFYVRGHALLALGSTGTYAHLEPVLRGLDAEEPVERAAAGKALGALVLPGDVQLAGIGLGMRVVDDLGDLHELDIWRDTVEVCHPVSEFLCSLRIAVAAAAWVRRLRRAAPAGVALLGGRLDVSDECGAGGGGAVAGEAAESGGE